MLKKRILNNNDDLRFVKWDYRRRMRFGKTIEQVMKENYLKRKLHKKEEYEIPKEDTLLGFKKEE